MFQPGTQKHTNPILLAYAELNHVVELDQVIAIVAHAEARVLHRGECRVGYPWAGGFNDLGRGHRTSCVDVNLDISHALMSLVGENSVACAQLLAVKRTAVI